MGLFHLTNQKKNIYCPEKGDYNRFSNYLFKATGILGKKGLRYRSSLYFRGRSRNF
jgi:hypothetical protein